MNVTAKKLTDLKNLRDACAITMGKQASAATLEKMYACEHSPIRTQVFWIEMRGIQSFVSVHFVRHKIGVEHYVKSLRDDRGGGGGETRESPVDHAMFINAAALIQMARKRLCAQSHAETRAVMREIKRAVADADPALAPFMVPECEYRGGVCHELKPCKNGEKP
ncbi:MAG: hypothetical protein FWF96_03000 [Kiritimatiellaeota bacterium]|nr:hypothetical protein [Kiritimatiellota bacterium]